MRAKSFEEFYEFVKKLSRSKISRQKAEEIYNQAGNILTIPELDSIITIEIKTLIRQLELYEEQVESVEFKIYPDGSLKEGLHCFDRLYSWRLMWQDKMMIT